MSAAEGDAGPVFRFLGLVGRAEVRTGSAALRRSCCRAVAGPVNERCAASGARERDVRAGDRWSAWS
ncbi:hypothetical protein AB4Z54_52270, partial [Streptomyces sp. MCAF7]